MSDTSTGSQYDAGGYEIRVGGRLDQRWSVCFDGMTLTNERDGTTNIQGPVADQAALHGLLTQAPGHRPAADLGDPGPA